MTSVAAGPEIERLIQLLARLPGLGPRSARRAALFLIKKRELIMAPLAAALQTAIEKIEVCKICGSIDTQNPCTICIDARRDPAAIVVVADLADARMRKCLHELREAEPDAWLIVISDPPVDRASDVVRELGGNAIMDVPFTVSDLARRLSELPARARPVS